jgi:2-C-methyl-D-erythritol 4-phosphate cytidylyltransferase
MPAVWAIVVAAGRGTRFVEPRDGAGSSGEAEPVKQFAELDGVRVVDRAVSTARAACDGVVVVLAAGARWDGPAVDAVVTGGATRSASVRAGLAAIPDDTEVIVVHDAARPLASSAMFASVIGAVRAGADAAVPAVPVADTIKRVDGSRVRESLARDELVAVQTPQAFQGAALRDAHRAGADTVFPEASDDAALIEACAGNVVIVAGDPRNVKITTPHDLVVATALLHASAAPVR